jgi:hypothetical protein
LEKNSSISKWKNSIKNKPNTKTDLSTLLVLP